MQILFEKKFGLKFFHVLFEYYKNSKRYSLKYMPKYFGINRHQGYNT